MSCCSTPHDTISSHSLHSVKKVPNTTDLVVFEPTDDVMFSFPPGYTESSTSLNITNISDSVITFKLKTPNINFVETSMPFGIVGIGATVAIDLECKQKKEAGNYTLQVGFGKYTAYEEGVSPDFE